MFTRQSVSISHVPEVVRYKWTNDPILNEGFVAFPKRLVRCLGRVLGPGLGWDHLAVVLAVVDYRRPNLTREPSADYLAFLAGLTVDRFKQCLADLVLAGLATVQGDDQSLRVSIDELVRRVIVATASDTDPTSPGEVSP